MCVTLHSERVRNVCEKYHKRSKLFMQNKSPVSIEKKKYNDFIFYNLASYFILSSLLLSRSVCTHIYFALSLGLSFSSPHHPLHRNVFSTFQRYSLQWFLCLLHLQNAKTPMNSCNGMCEITSQVARQVINHAHKYSRLTHAQKQRPKSSLDLRPRNDCWPCHWSYGSCTITDQFLCVLWWTKWQWDRLFYDCFCFPLSISFHRQHR